MKTRIVRPLESPDEPYMADKITARARAHELSMSQYKTSLTPPSWPAEMASESTADRKLARAETALPLAVCVAVQARGLLCTSR